MNDRTRYDSLRHRTNQWSAIATMLIFTLSIGLLDTMTGSSRAAEIRLRSQCQTDASIITLGHVADVLTSDRRQIETLSAIELCAAPVAGQRFVRLREIQDRLLAHGINLLEHRFSGSSQVAVVRAKPTRTQRDRPLSYSITRTANQRACEAVAAYLRENVSADQPWNVEAQLTDDQVKLLSDPDLALSVVPTVRPEGANWTGPQRFQFRALTFEGPMTFVVDAQVTRPPMVIVAVTSLSRGTIIGPANVAVRPATSLERTTDALESIEEAIGKETKQAIPLGKILQRKMVRSPLLVRRGEFVTVHVRTSGIRIRTTARARDDGAFGDLVTVESTLDKKTYLARVAAPQEVEVYAQPTRADWTGAGRAAQPFRR
ncbi:MAG: flagellar basal body P-ring formation chaperone FlgA [Thermoguttaceae bacterium]